ncbi:flavodoxin [Caballeronia choica]|jgi:flavodoxin|uniref:Flavodoxin n=1 Tax=Caballeronia choica TaxID=326476 RepID=A0A158L025_9BURK|nr:NAD(P)H-dependent oxidoreductase [Caballeronia choica]SAL86746.1 flavodoxin [Caballeronia choica]
MSRVLIVYFSRTGATRRVAAALATTLHADVEEIIDRSDRSGTLGTLRCVLDSVMGRSASIEPMRHDLSAYHMVVIGTPVWAGRVSAPVRAWLATHRRRLPRVAFFCTLAGRGSESALQELCELAAKQPVARCAISQRNAPQGEETRALNLFAQRIERTLAHIEEIEWAA